MPNHLLQAKASLNILKPTVNVFQSIVQPHHMCNYFIAQSSGPLTEGNTVTWKFPEMDMEFQVRVTKVETDRLIQFNWGEGENQTEVIISLRDRGDECFVSITESGKPYSEENLKWLRGNTEGWANFLACLKAYMEYSINLRKGAFLAEQIPEATS